MTIDVASLVLSAVGVLLGAAGIVIALVQIRGARRAAEQARDAAREAAGRAKAVQATVESERLVSEAREVVRRLRAGDFHPAAEAAMRLRGGIALLARAELTQRSPSQAAWGEVARAASVVHGQAEGFASTTRRSTRRVLDCIELAARVADSAAALSTVAAGRATQEHPLGQPVREITS